MHFAVAPEHLNFFKRHHYIEFEDLLTEAEVQTLSQALTERVGTGYDCWRENRVVQKFVLRPQFAEIASNLTKVRPLRIAFDLLLTSSPFEKPLPLEELSSIQGVVCGCILQLSSPPLQASQESLVIEEEMTTLIPLPKKSGSALFFSAEIPLSFDYLATTPPHEQLLIVYAKEKSLYTMQENDPHIHALKSLGYGFGDRLKDTTHPILYRG
ncbi:MAG: hypothetical protein K1060chlam2_00700 [Chlamydiae bacterium]|nr:hypothetical protein [Chlamydiota bacterium]